MQYTDNYAHRASESFTMRKAFKETAKKLQKDLIQNYFRNWE